MTNLGFGAVFRQFLTPPVYPDYGDIFAVLGLYFFTHTPARTHVHTQTWLTKCCGLSSFRKDYGELYILQTRHNLCSVILICSIS